MAEASPDQGNGVHSSVSETVNVTPGITMKSLKSGLTHSISLKLDEKFFLLWSQQVNGVITAHNLHRFILNPQIPLRYATEEDRIADKVSEEYQKWLTQDQTLFTWLLASLSDGILPRVLGCKHAYQVWDKIHKHFHSMLKAKVRQLRSELKNTKKASRSISEYLLRIKAIVDSLVAVGDTITEQDHIDAILEGLPEEYNSFVMMIFSRLYSPSVEDIKSLLMVQEAQFEKFRQELASPSVSANIAHSGNGNSENNGNSGNSGVLNSNSGSASGSGNNSGNFRGGFRGRSRGRGRGRGGGQRPTCQICGKPGHEALRCWSRYDRSYVPSVNQMAPSVNHMAAPMNQMMAPMNHMFPMQQHVMRPAAHMALSPYSPYTPELRAPSASDSQGWFPDSGASYHLTANAQNLTQSYPFHGQDQVMMGNGQDLYTPLSPRVSWYIQGSNESWKQKEEDVSPFDLIAIIRQDHFK